MESTGTGSSPSMHEDQGVWTSGETVEREEAARKRAIEAVAALASARSRTGTGSMFAAGMERISSDEDEEEDQDGREGGGGVVVGGAGKEKESGVSRGPPVLILTPGVRFLARARSSSISLADVSLPDALMEEIGDVEDTTAPLGGTMTVSGRGVGHVPRPFPGDVYTWRDGAEAGEEVRVMTADDELVPVENPDAFPRVVITGSTRLSTEQRRVCLLLLHCLELREKHVYRRPDSRSGSAFGSPTATTSADAEVSPKVDIPALSPSALPEEGGTATALPAAPSAATALPAAVAAAQREPEGPSGAGAAAAGGGGVQVLTPQAARRTPLPSRYETEMAAIKDPRVRSMFYKRRPEPPYEPFGRNNTGKAPESVRVEFVDGIFMVVGAEDGDGDGDGGEGASAGAGAGAGAAAGAAATAGGSRDGGGDGGSGGERMCGAYPVREAPSGRVLYPVSTLEEYLHDYNVVVSIVHQAAVKSMAYKRLQLMTSKFEIHRQLNADNEQNEQKRVPHRDFYNIRKVDTHVHHSACMNQKHLLRFIKHKLKYHATDVVSKDRASGQEMTLADVFERLHITAYDLSVDTLDMHADSVTFHRFDRFNLKYNPMGQSLLREVFLKVDNHLRGRYLAEVTQEVMSDLHASKYSMAEYRLSIYGRKASEWDTLGEWVVDHKLVSPNVRWMIQIPRLYQVYRETGQVSCFEDMLANIFRPLFEVTLDPASHPKLHDFLNVVVGFDCVDDESKQEAGRDAHVPHPREWTSRNNPPYYYWLFYLASNLRVLNELRASRGMPTFSFRPHGGEAGDVDHLAACFLLAEGVNHGINLKYAPALQYLYYLAQIGLAVSPLSNNRLFVEYNANPFFTFFSRGLHVSLSTDDPLLLHYTKEPLVEEYCVAAQVWKLSSADMSEIARNSVIQSGFEHAYKAHFIGPAYGRPGPRGNDIFLTNVPNMRLQFRHECLETERALIRRGARLAIAAAYAVTGEIGTPAAVGDDAGDLRPLLLVAHSALQARAHLRQRKERAALGEDSSAAADYEPTPPQTGLVSPAGPRALRGTPAKP